MNRRPSNLLKPLALGAVLATAFTVAAQQQTIMFSKPKETPEEKADSFLQESPTKLSGRAGEFNAPKKLFNFSPEPSLPRHQHR
jgi:hypothetical protein